MGCDDISQIKMPDYAAGLCAAIVQRPCEVDARLAGCVAVVGFISIRTDGTFPVFGTVTLAVPV